MEDLNLKHITDEIDSAMKEVHQALAGVFEPGVDDQSNTIEREFVVGDRPELVLNAVAGQVRVDTVPGNVIRVRAIKHGSGSVLGRASVEMAQEGNRVSIETRLHSGLGVSIGAKGISVDFQIEVPVHCSVRIKTVSSPVTVGGTQAQVQVETVSGDIDVSDVREELHVISVSGDVVARGVEGRVSLRTTSGDVGITDAQLSELHAQTVSGDLRLVGSLHADGQYFAKTVSGDLWLRVPPNSGLMVQLRSVSGDVHCELPAQIIKSGRRNWQGRVNGGGANLEMHSISGDLRIMAGDKVREDTRSASPTFADTQAAADVPAYGDTPASDSPAANDTPTTDAAAGSEPVAASTTAPTPVSSPPSGTNEILKALERGEITVEEAMRRLDGLE